MAASASARGSRIRLIRKPATTVATASRLTLKVRICPPRQGFGDVLRGLSERTLSRPDEHRQNVLCMAGSCHAPARTFPIRSPFVTER